MRKTLTLLLLALSITFTAQGQLLVEPEQQVECSVWFNKGDILNSEGKKISQQGMEIWGDHIFSLMDKGYCNVYSFSRQDTLPIAQFKLASFGNDNHANNASFGTETKKGASFPLLYITNGKVGSDIEWTCFVESITKKGKRFSSEIAQTIVLDGSDWASLGYTPVFGAPSWMVDRERGFLWVFSARKRTVISVTKNAWENQYVATKFRIPLLSEGKVIRLSGADILDQVVFPFDVWATQAGCVHDGKIYYCFGFGKKYELTTSRIRIYDTDRRVISNRYELENEVPEEMEDLVVRNGWMYVNTNSRRVYKVSLPKVASLPVTALDEIRRCPEKAGGTYFIDTFSDPDSTPSPEGYEPFYISGYFRHGARQIDDDKTYKIVYESLKNGHESKNLTEFGEEVWNRLEQFWPNLQNREGDLTMIGFRQVKAIGQRMADNYPQVFNGNPSLKTYSTNVLRVTASMGAFNQGVQSRYPDLQWSLVGYSKSYLPFLNPYTGECPGNLETDQILRDKRGEWYGKYKEYCLSRIDTDAFLSRIFKNPESIKITYEPLDLEFRFWLLASLTQCLDRQVPFWDLFTPEETLAWYTCEAYKSYMQKGPHPVNHGRGWGLGSRVVRDIINTSDKEISAGLNGVNLRFGHDAVIMSLLTVLQVNDWDAQANSPEEAAQHWKMWNIPMASNIQLIFYRSGKTPEILVKVMLNEKVCNLPLNTSFGCYYKWSDIYKYYSDRCDYIEKNYLTNYKL
jgi:hypothetical protein